MPFRTQTAYRVVRQTLSSYTLVARPRYPRAIRNPIQNPSNFSSPYSTGGQTVSEQNAGIAKSILMIGIPSAALMYAVLQFFDPHQRAQHSKEMKQWLQDENKRIGRKHDCEEIHAADIEKWIEGNPEHEQKWFDVRKGYEEFKAKKGRV